MNRVHGGRPRPTGAVVPRKKNARINFVYGRDNGYARVASTEHQRQYPDRRLQACVQRTVRRKQVHSCQQNTLAAAEAMCSIGKVHTNILTSPVTLKQASRRVWCDVHCMKSIYILSSATGTTATAWTQQSSLSTLSVASAYLCRCCAVACELARQHSVRTE